jgi:glycosyltransferase involved in cell wall biosynthesis
VRIGIDVRCLSLGRRTGVEEYTVRILENIFAADKKNSYRLFFNSFRKRKLDYGWEEKYPNVKIKYFRFPNKIFNFLVWFFRWPKIDRLLGGVDVFFLPNINFLALEKKTHLVSVCHDLSFEHYPETFSWKSRLWHYLINPRRLFTQADFVVSVSQSTQRDLINIYKIDPQKTAVVYSGLVDDFRELNRNDLQFIEAKEKYNLPYEFILYLGTIEPRKNLVSLILAFEGLQRNPDVNIAKYKLVIAGYAGSGNQTIISRIEKSPARNKIIFTGPVE